MKLRKCLVMCALAGILIGLLLTTGGLSQRRQPYTSSKLFVNPPGMLSTSIGALGDRARKPGLERVVLQGQFSDDLGRHLPVRVILQVPEIVRIEGLNPRGPAILHDQSGRHRAASWVEEQLVETFYLDTLEGLLAAVQKGSSLEQIGVRFSPAGAEPGYSGPYFDIYELTNPPGGSETKDWLRRYLFNSDTGLLASTQHFDESRAAHIETRFSNWLTVQGSTYPSLVERFENGRVVFRFTFHKMSADSRRDPAMLAANEEPVDGKEE